MNNNPVKLTYEFDSNEDLQLFLNDIGSIVNKRLKPKKENDRRGCGTAELHKKVKEYKLLNPDLTYRECLKEISYKKIENNINLD